MNMIASMNRIKQPAVWKLFLIAAAVVLVSFGVLLVRADGPLVVPSTGMMCTENALSTFTLSAKEGYISVPDGNRIYMWSYAEGTDDFQHPGPILCVNQGDTVTIVLHNFLREPSSIAFPGQTDVRANGLPVEPEFDTQGNMTSFVQSAAANGGTITYSFVASEPGTYYYQSGTNSAVQAQMGLFGGLVIRPTMGPEYAYNDPLSRFNPSTEYIMMLSEIDPILHREVELGHTFDMNQYNARYFLINGRGFPDTLAPNNATWLPGQPYGSLAYIHPYKADDGSGAPDINPYPALDRFIGLGVESYPFHPHAFNSRIIARDGRLLQGSGGEDLSDERFSLPINPGQTSDAIYSWTDQYKWNPNSTDPNDPATFPVQIPGQQNLPQGLFYGSPFLGNQDTVPVGEVSFNQCGEFYHIAHNHNLQQITGWGTILIGQITFTRIDPPLPNNCQ